MLALVSSLHAGQIVWPVSATITSDFGPRTNPCSGCSTYHNGVDLGAASGTIVGAPSAGTVASYAYDSCGGNVMRVTHENGYDTRFMHLSAAVASTGAAVTRNQNICKSGNTGSCSTGAHLHFEVRRDGVPQSIPGSAGTYVTRNTLIPKDYPGLADAPPVPPDGPASSVVVMGDSSIWIFGVASDTTVQYNPCDSNGWRTIPNGSGFGRIKAVYNGYTNRISVFGTAPAGGPVYVNTQTGVGGGWGGWVNLGGTVTDVDAVVDKNNRLAAFGVAPSNGSVWRQRQNADGSWPKSWTSIGGEGFAKVKGSVYSDGRLSVHGIGGATALWQASENTAGGTWGTFWSWGGTDVDCIYAATQSNGKPVVFCTTKGTGSVHAAFQRADNSLNWLPLGGQGAHRVTGVKKPDGTLAVFMMGPGTVYSKVQTAVGEAFPSSWSSLGQALQTFDCSVRPSGALVVAGRAYQQLYFSMALQSGNNGSWGWSYLAGSFK